MTQYSQHNEEKILLDHFGERNGKLLDIGAFDGKAFSNTLALIERGWSAVLIEPSARAFDKLMGLHKGNPKVTLVQALVTAHPGTLRRFHQCGDALSTTEQRNLDIWHETEFVETWVPPLSVEDLMSIFPGPYDFVNIDTEGTSVDVWEALLPLTFRWPEVVCVEHDGLPVEPKGYERIYYDGNNVILKRVKP